MEPLELVPSITVGLPTLSALRVPPSLLPSGAEMLESPMHVSYLLITVVQDVMYLLDVTACLYNLNH